MIVGTHFLLALLVLATATVRGGEGLGERARTGRRRRRRGGFGWVGLVLAGACGIIVFTGTLSTAAGPHPGDSAEIERFWNLLDAVYIHVRATAAFGIWFLVLLVWLARNRDRAGVLVPSGRELSSCCWLRWARRAAVA